VRAQAGVAKSGPEAYVLGVISSGKAGIAGVAVATVVGAAAFLMVVLKLWFVAAILGSAWIVLMTLAMALMLRADRGELMARSRENERWMDAWVRGMSRVSGGWNPRRRP
jgi:fatty acid desaturase